MRPSVRATALYAGAAAFAAAAGAVSLLRSHPAGIFTLASALPLAFLQSRPLPARRPPAPASRAAVLLARLARADSRDPVVYFEIAHHVTLAAGPQDSYMGSHSERTADYAVLLGKELGLHAHELDQLRLSALLHDIGKLDVRPCLLAKPGRLTPAERAEIRQHARRGADMLRGNPAMAELLPAIELHHECWDGTGYPYGLSGEAIPLSARIVAVADTYDALTNARPYQAAAPPSHAAAVITALERKRFCPVVTSAFVRLFQSGAVTQPSRLN